MVLLACPAFCSHWRLLFGAQSIELAQLFFFSWSRGSWDETSVLVLFLNGVFTLCVNCRESFIHSLHYLLSSTSKVSDTNPCACCCWQMVLHYRIRWGCKWTADTCFSEYGLGWGLKVPLECFLSVACLLKEPDFRSPFSSLGYISGILAPRKL